MTMIPPSCRQPDKHSLAPYIAWLLAAAVFFAMPQYAAVAAEPELLIRADDIGMNHTVNQALRKLTETGVPFSASVMIACPWYLEAAQILRDNPQVSVGIHLTLNSEWKDYKWGPVLGASRVPTLVDGNGHFFATAVELLENGMDLGEVEAELRAQIERAKRAGLDVDYLDYHMLTAVSTPQLRGVVEKLAAEYGLGLSRYFGEPSLSLWDVEPDKKLVTLLDGLRHIETGKPTLLVMHLGEQTPEMNALVDVNNPADPYRVALHRARELQAITSPAFFRIVSDRNIRFVTYRDMIDRYGLKVMKAPQSFDYSMNERADD
jgi:predicted glycoside hydrolase/deacetylase ChbG (UPF0249 family)